MIKAAQPRESEYFLADGEGLYLRVRPAGKVWIYRYKYTGRPTKLSLGAYQNGKTVLPASARQLFANAQRRDYNHRRTLSRNIVADANAPRPANACAHHIVALKHEDAELARRRLCSGSENLLRKDMKRRVHRDLER